MNRKSQSTKTLLALIIPPILIVLIPLLLLWILPIFKVYIVNFPIVLVMVLYPLFFYFLWILTKVPYTDPTVLDTIVMTNAPRDVEKQLKSISKKYFVTKEIILYLGNSNRSPIQTDIVNYLNNMGVDLTSTRIRKILEKLESMHLISSVKGTHEREYSLTKKGIWCYNAIRYYFPKRNFWFVVRNQLIKKELPPFPDQD